MKFNFKIHLVTAAALLTASSSFAQFGGLLNNMMKQVEQAQGQAAPAPSTDFEDARLRGFRASFS